MRQMLSCNSTCRFLDGDWIYNICIQSLRYAQKHINCRVRSAVLDAPQIRKTHLTFKSKILLGEAFLCAQSDYGSTDIVMY